MSARLRPPGLPALFALVFAVGGWIAGLVRLSDNSFLWHLRTGRLILDSGIPRDDPYSYTVPGIKWVAQSWLAETLYALVEDAAGAWGLRLLTAACGAAAGWMVFRLAMTFARNRVRAGLIALVALRAIMGVWSERPLMFGLLEMLALVWITEVPESWVGRHAAIALPLTIWLFANLHGTWILGVGYVGLHLAGRWAEGCAPWAGRERLLALAALGGTASVVANPYGLDLLLFPVRLVLRGETLGGVVEWMSPDFRTAPGSSFGLWILVFVAVSLLGRHAPGRRDVMVALPFLFLALWAMRNIGIATIVMIPVAARSVAAEADRPFERSALGWVVAVGLIVFAATSTLNASGSGDYDLRGYPVAAMREVEEQGYLGGRLFTTDAWAGYEIAEYWPEQRVFLDDRYDTYPRRVVEDYDVAATVKPEWSEILDEYRVEVVVWPRDRALTQVLAEAEGWVRIHADEVAAVFVRREPVPAG